jgi:hypothetical protein
MWFALRVKAVAVIIIDAELVSFENLQRFGAGSRASGIGYPFGRRLPPSEASHRF